MFVRMVWLSRDVLTHVIYSHVQKKKNNKKCIGILLTYNGIHRELINERILNVFTIKKTSLIQWTLIYIYI